MLQQVEYDPMTFLEWFRRWPDYRRVMRRKTLVRTKKALLLLLVTYAVWLAVLAWALHQVGETMYLSAAYNLLVMPFVSLGCLLIVCLAGSAVLSMTRRRILKQASDKVAGMKAVKIAVLGSYGKTTMKELLATVLSENKNVAATPGNKNVDISHARWVMNKLTGQEDVLIIEFGEGHVGDIASMARMFKPDIAVITGLAPNHLDNFSDYDALKHELASIKNFVEPDKLFAPSDLDWGHHLGADEFTPFTVDNVYGWRVSDVKSDLKGTSFRIKKGRKSMRLASELVGGHLVPPIALAAAIADELGLKGEQIEVGIAKTRAFEHRMQVLNIGGAVVVDDTYNGNIEGMRAGLRLLSQAEARRKIYVTPGLVEQGGQTEAVHSELGRLIAEARPDVVVLMDNSVCPIIRESLEKNGFAGELRIETDPLGFYINLQYQVANGDVVLMQNDWTDNYE